MPSRAVLKKLGLRRHEHLVPFELST
jgi:ribosomal protein L30/L7E